MGFMPDLLHIHYRQHTYSINACKKANDKDIELFIVSYAPSTFAKQQVLSVTKPEGPHWS